MATSTKQRLLDAAIEVLRHHGAAALTVRAITEEAGCSTTGIYTHFGDKNGLVEALFIDGFESFDRALLPAYETDDLVEAGRRYRHWAMDNPTRYLVMFGRAVPDFEPGPEALDRAGRSFALLVAALDRRGVAEPTGAAYHLYACLHGYVMLELVGLTPPGVASPEELFERGLHHDLARLGQR
jgi:AcrR family transcriptional regulator